MTKENQPKTVSFQLVKDALLDMTKPFPPKYLHSFSDISFEDLAELKKIWGQVQPNRRVGILEDLEELIEADTLVCFDDIARFALNDEDPRARAVAIRLLWECDDFKLYIPFTAMLENDPEEIVRAAAASGLGSFVYHGELEEIKPEIKRKVEDTLFRCMNGKDAILVRRRCLEALGFSSRKEVHRAIEQAYESEDSRWRSSALFAMGRSADNRWQNAVIKSIHDEDGEVRYEAVRAAGELSLTKARIPIYKLFKDPDALDEDMHTAVIWSLSQIGGQKVRTLIEGLLDDCEDDEEAEFLEKALDNLDFNEGMAIPGLLEVDDTTEEDMYNVIDLADEDEGEDEYDDEESMDEDDN